MIEFFPPQDIEIAAKLTPVKEPIRASLDNFEAEVRERVDGYIEAGSQHTEPDERVQAFNSAIVVAQFHIEEEALVAASLVLAADREETIGLYNTFVDAATRLREHTYHHPQHTYSDVRRLMRSAEPSRTEDLLADRHFVWHTIGQARQARQRTAEL